MSVVGNLQPTHSANQIKSPNGLYKGQTICLYTKKGNKTICRIVVVNGVHLKTKTTDRNYILVHDPEHPCKTSRIYLDNYAVTDRTTGKFDQTRWIESC